MVSVIVRSAALVFTSFTVGTAMFNPTMSSALSLGFVLSAWFGYEVLEYLDRRGSRAENELKAEVRMTSEALTQLSVRLAELEPRVQRIDNRTRRAGEP